MGGSRRKMVSWTLFNKYTMVRESVWRLEVGIPKHNRTPNSNSHSNSNLLYCWHMHDDKCVQVECIPIPNPFQRSRYPKYRTWNWEYKLYNHHFQIMFSNLFPDVLLSSFLQASRALSGHTWFDPKAWILKYKKLYSIILFGNKLLVLNVQGWEWILHHTQWILIG